MFTFFAVVRLWDDLDTLSLTMVVVVSILVPVLLMPISFIMSSLFDISDQFKYNLIPIIEASSDVQLRQYWKRQLNSCLIIRCQVGGMYHMEAKAKLTLFQHMINGVVCLLVNIRKS